MTIEFTVGRVDSPQGEGKFVITVDDGIVRYSARNNPQGSLEHSEIVEATGDKRCFGGGTVKLVDNRIELGYMSANFGSAPREAITSLEPVILEAYRGHGLEVSELSFRPVPHPRINTSGKYEAFLENGGKL